MQGLVIWVDVVLLCCVLCKGICGGGEWSVRGLVCVERR